MMEMWTMTLSSVFFTFYWDVAIGQRRRKICRRARSKIAFQESSVCTSGTRRPSRKH